MADNNINDLIEEGKKHLAELQKEIEKLAETAGKAANLESDEISKKANEIIKEATVHVEKAKTLVEEKTKDVMASEGYKNFEADGKKVVDEVQVKIEELTNQVNDIVNDFSNKWKDIFGRK